MSKNDPLKEELKAWDEDNKNHKHVGPGNAAVYIILFALGVFIVCTMFGCQHRQGLKPQNNVAIKGPVAGWTCHSCGYFNLVDNKQVRHCGVCGAAR